MIYCPLNELVSTFGFQAASLIGTASFTLSGFLLGVRKHLDILGLFIVAALTAVGGGVIRDILLNKVPSILTHATPFCTIITVIIVAFVLRLHHKGDLERRLLFVLSDSIGLVAFSITGATLAMEASLNVFGVMMLAFATAVGGGIIRDTLVNEVPFLLKSEVYGSVALGVGGSLYLLNTFGVLNMILIGVIGALALALRLLAYFKNWHLPKL